MTIFCKQNIYIKINSEVGNIILRLSTITSYISYSYRKILSIYYVLLLSKIRDTFIIENKIYLLAIMWTSNTGYVTLSVV